MKKIFLVSALALMLSGCTETVGGTVACALLASQIDKFEPGTIAHEAAVANYNVFCN